VIGHERANDHPRSDPGFEGAGVGRRHSSQLDHGEHDHGEHDHAELDHGEHDHDHATGIKGFLRSTFKRHSHDAADSVDSALESSQEGIRALKITLIALALTAAAQAILVAATGSVALLADTIHNFSDALTAVPLWIAFVLARRAPTRRYTYGYGRAEDLAGVFIVAMITLSAVVAGWESIRRLLDPQEITHVRVVFAAGIIGFLGNEAVAVFRIRVGRRIGSAALVADGLHARTDGFTSLAVAAGALGVAAGFPLADPIVGLGIAAAILIVLRGAARAIYRRLMDAVDPDLTDTAEAAVRSTPGLVDVEHVRLRWIGHRMVADAGIVVEDALTIVDAHAIANDAHHRLLHGLPRLDDVTIHVSPSPTGDIDHHQLLRHHQIPAAEHGH
jgi:cation diffusion facilitator family transporter